MRFIGRSCRKMEGVKTQGRIQDTIVQQNPHQGGQRCRAVTGSPDGAGIGRCERLERIAEAFPELVDLGEGLDLQQGLDTLVLGVFSATLEQPAVHVLAFIGARVHDLLQLGLRMVHEIADQPQLQGVEMSDVAAIVQVKALRRIRGVEFGDLCLRGPWRLEMGPYRVRKCGRVVLRIHRAIDGGETRGVVLGVVGQELERFLGGLAAVFRIKTPEKYLPFMIRKTFQIGAALWTIAGLEL